MLFKEIKLDIHGDERGSLISIEGMKNVPFNIKRVYYIFGTKEGVARGFHAHRNLQQILICTSGSCKLKLDNGSDKNIISLDSPSIGILVGSMIWREMFDFSPDCVLMVLASESYDEEDYIRDYDVFLECFQNKGQRFFKHNNAIVESDKIGEGTKVWAFSHIFPGAKIGSNCNINDHTLIENDVILGNNVTVKSGVHIWDGVHIGNNVFIGPSTVFTNDLRPRSKRYPSEFHNTIIEDFATIGANSTIVAGNRIGKHAMIGAGSVVTKDVPPYSLWYGNPAIFIGYVCECGEKLTVEKYCSRCMKDLTSQILNSKWGNK